MYLVDKGQFSLASPLLSVDSRGVGGRVGLVIKEAE